MIVSHERRFVFFPDPLGASAHVARALTPWADSVPEPRVEGAKVEDMTPQEAEWAFDSCGLAFRSYLRIAVVEHPFARISRLFDRIRAEDRLWQLRELAGFPPPKFENWLSGIKADGMGAAGRRGPRWRQFGAWSAKRWQSDAISHSVRLEALETDLIPVLGQLGIAPAFDTLDIAEPPNWGERYSAGSCQLMQQRYGWDLAQYDYTFRIPQSAA